MSIEKSSKRGSGESPRRRIVLGTRGSELALAQTQLVEEALRKKWELEVETEVIRTRGDESVNPRRTAILAGNDRAAGRKGIFTAALERALIEERIDVAVHSAKDLPSAIESGLTIAAVLPRAAVEDILITKSPLETLPQNPTVATGSIRRQRQLCWLRSDANIVGLRGNVPTRLRKFIESDWDAIILARAGLERLGFAPPQFQLEKQKFFAEILALEKFLPAGGQGVIALQTRASDLPVYEMVSKIDDHETHLCLRAEREFLRQLHGDCDLPVGVHARFVAGDMELRAQVFGDASAPKMASGRGDDPEQLGAAVFEKLHYEQRHE